MVNGEKLFNMTVSDMSVYVRECEFNDCKPTLVVVCRDGREIGVLKFATHQNLERYVKGMEARSKGRIDTLNNIIKHIRGY